MYRMRKQMIREGKLVGMSVSFRTRRTGRRESWTVFFISGQWMEVVTLILSSNKISKLQFHKYKFNHNMGLHRDQAIRYCTELGIKRYKYWVNNQSCQHDEASVKILELWHSKSIWVGEHIYVPGGWPIPTPGQKLPCLGLFSLHVPLHLVVPLQPLSYPLLYNKPIIVRKKKGNSKAVLLILVKS